MIYIKRSFITLIALLLVIPMVGYVVIREVWVKKVFDKGPWFPEW